MSFNITNMGIAEASLTLSMFLWALVLSVPDLANKDKSYLPFLDTLPEWVWAFICGVIGLIMLFGILTKNKFVRETGMILSTMFWTFMTTLVLLGGHYLHSISYFICATTALWIYIRKAKKV